MGFADVSWFIGICSLSPKIWHFRCGRLVRIPACWRPFARVASAEPVTRPEGRIYPQLSGYTGVSYVVSDDHEGMVKAIERHFQDAVWQRRQIHFVRNELALCSRPQRPMVLLLMRSTWRRRLSRDSAWCAPTTLSAGRGQALRTPWTERQMNPRLPSVSEAGLGMSRRHGGRSRRAISADLRRCVLEEGSRSSLGILGPELEHLTDKIRSFRISFGDLAPLVRRLPWRANARQGPHQWLVRVWVLQESPEGPLPLADVPALCVPLAQRR